MSGAVIVGLQWGDEGKGKLVDLFAPKFDAVARFQGGSNAGHTVVIGDEKRVFHVMPSGALQGRLCIVGSGVAVDTGILLEELSTLEGAGVKPKLLLSGRAQVTTRLHRIHDGLEEARRGSGAVGTTRRGIGPTYSDRALRVGLKVADLLEPDILEDRLRVLYELKKKIFKEVYGYTDMPDFDGLYDELLDHGRRLRGYIGKVEYELNRLVSSGGRVLFEGAQGTLLDVDYGTYPYSTSSNTVAAASSVGTGLPPNRISHVVGVAKAYTTRVGSGPFPTEDKGEHGSILRDLGKEYGSTTGRPRRCGWFDAVIVRYAAMLNGADQIILTKLDVLSDFEKIKVATAYRIDGEETDEMPLTAEELDRAKPVYEELEGWRSYGYGFWRKAREEGEDALPKPLRGYLARLEELIGVQIRGVSYGPSREEFLDLGLEL